MMAFGWNPFYLICRQGFMDKKNKLSALDFAYISIFTAMIAICAWITIPTAVPFTLQLFGVFLAVGVLGGKRGSIAVLIYVLLGLAGAPVFSGFGGGIGYLFGATGGYILGFLLCALAMWLMEHLLPKQKWALALAMATGLVVCYAFGTAWFVAIYAGPSEATSLWTALTACVIPYLIPDLIKLILALALSNNLAKFCALEKKD